MKKEHHGRHVIEMPSPHPTTTEEEFKVLQYVYRCRVFMSRQRGRVFMFRQVKGEK